VDSIVDAIRKQDGQPDLKAISLRSRIGKGACQGTFCGVRVTAYLFDQGELTFDQCLAGLREFLQLVQSELLEALYCGLFGLEL
jgi:glycerol-3-phosphate dehydrogenase